MEDSRNIQIAENSFPRNFGNNDKTTFLFEIFQNYLLFSESLFSSFFTGNDIEVQRNIIRTNFGLTDEDIQSWTNRASRYNMTPECFAFFLHVAMYSATRPFAAALDGWSK
ncbi:unnamed protein product [Rhizophagus irregularis]|nr:unnamed protein product [Rhizophagus irregularis]